MLRVFSFDQSFCLQTLESVLCKRDFLGVSAVDQVDMRKHLLAQALISANSHFNSPSVSLTAFPLKGKTVYRWGRPQDELVEQKLRLNLKKCALLTVDGRSQIVRNLDFWRTLTLSNNVS